MEQDKGKDKMLEDMKKLVFEAPKKNTAKKGGRKKKKEETTELPKKEETVENVPIAEDKNEDKKFVEEEKETVVVEDICDKNIETDELKTNTETTIEVDKPKKNKTYEEMFGPTWMGYGFYDKNYFT